MTSMLVLPDIQFKITMTNMLNVVLENVDNTHRQIGNSTRGRNYKKESKEMVEIRNPETEMKDGFDRLFVGSAQLRKINQSH